MITTRQGNLFSSRAEALVNTVNTVGVMGKGVALQFRERFPENYELYRKACKDGQVQIGKMLVTETNRIEGPRWIINFPTKKHWKGRSQYEFIKAGLVDLVRVIKEKGIRSLAIPPLGAGHGGLNWNRVQQMIAASLEMLPVDIDLFEPRFEPQVERKASAVKLTKPRAMILSLIHRFQALGFETTLLVIHKLAYLLQLSGQHGLRLQFTKSHYGPYANNLQHLLKYLQGSYLVGARQVMNATPSDTFELVLDRMSEVNQFVEDNCTTAEKQRLENVYRIIEGFESPFGMEVLSTVAMIMQEHKEARNDIRVMMREVKEWSDRKASISPHHLEVAYQRLASFRQQLYVN